MNEDAKLHRIRRRCKIRQISMRKNANNTSIGYGISVPNYFVRKYNLAGKIFNFHRAVILNKEVFVIREVEK
jgi:hypothetical protein